uniref:Uncharacterized protein n=1 Tax=viral metagenome TaxID=1070528 RepID=A0A6C0AM94_9ZZZZ
MDLSNKRIIVGGWPAFAEQTGVNKKEPVENFDWMPESDKGAYTDMRETLDKIEGAREFVKNFVRVNDKRSFDGPIGNAIGNACSYNHSGASFSGLLWCYQRALKDWDMFVLNAKQYQGMRKFREQQIPMWKANLLVENCNEWWNKFGSAEANILETKILTECASLCLAGMQVPDIRKTLLEIMKDLKAIEVEDARKEAENRHHSLMESVEWLYKNPKRWFDGPQGCSLSPGHPSNITKRVMAEMEAKFPGYTNHIARVLAAMQSSNMPTNCEILFSDERQEVNVGF